MAIHTASMAAIGYEISCPECEETIPSDTGSLFWSRDELELKEKGTAVCPSCQSKFRYPLPRRIA